MSVKRGNIEQGVCRRGAHGSCGSDEVGQVTELIFEMVQIEAGATRSRKSIIAALLQHSCRMIRSAGPPRGKAGAAEQARAQRGPTPGKDGEGATERK